MQTTSPPGRAEPPRPLLFGSALFWSSRHASGHPLAIPRVSLAIDLCRALGWVEPAVYREARPATVAELTRFHDADYVAAVAAAERSQALAEPDRRRFNLGINGNPIYEEVFRRPATACGASIEAARLLARAPAGVVFNPMGGTHHGRRAFASGYCVFNDPVLAILTLLDGGCDRVGYVDLDAHFGDGVQTAFEGDGRVLTLSIHEDGRWPMRRGDAGDGPGGIDDRGGGTACNLPVPAGLDDSELAFLVERVVLPTLTAFRPDALVIQCGCDALADDPMTRLALSNRALWDAVRALRGLAPQLLVLGGGGYNPYAVGRCWAGVWATLNDFPVPDRLPERAAAMLRRTRWSHRLGRAPEPRWSTTLADPRRPGPVRDVVRRLASRLVRPAAEM
jgi:acetoin utilization protein AcuC